MNPLLPKIAALGFEDLERLKAQAAREGTDFYSLVVSEVSASPIPEVTKEDRTLAKVLLFGYVYAYRPL